MFLLKDINAESRVEKPLPMYVPRDEQFEESKRDAFSTGRLKAVLHNLLPGLQAKISEKNKDLKGYQDIDRLYSEGLLLKLGIKDDVLKRFPLPKIVTKFKDGDLLKFDIPKIISSKVYSSTMPRLFDNLFVCLFVHNIF